MAVTVSADLVISVSALVVALVAVALFLRATETPRRGEPEARRVVVDVAQGALKLPELGRVTKKRELDQARRRIRSLSLQQEILTMVLKRLFEAEDNGEITREERVKLSKGYEEELKRVGQELKKAELLVSLGELEEIRRSIIEQFQQTLEETQSKIDLIVGELGLAPPEPKPSVPEKPRTPARRARPKPKEAPKKKEAEEEEEPSEPAPDSVEERLKRIQEEVMKELEELERLELEQ